MDKTLRVSSSVCQKPTVCPTQTPAYVHPTVRSTHTLSPFVFASCTTHHFPGKDKEIAGKWNDEASTPEQWKCFSDIYSCAESIYSPTKPPGSG